MFKIQTTRSYSTIPMNGINDDKLSLKAKCLYVILFSVNNIKTLDDIKKLTSDSIEVIQEALNELILTGYVEKTENYTYKVNIIPNKKVATIVDVDSSVPFIDEAPIYVSSIQTPKPKDNKFTKMVNAVKEYTEDKALRDALISYFSARLHPDVDSRFAARGDLQIYQIKNILESLTATTGEDKVAIVKYCLEKQYFKFFDIPVKKTLDGVKSESYTQEEIENIRKRAEYLDSIGEQGTF